MENKKIHSFGDDVLGTLDATALAQRIKNKEIKASEAVAASIERAKKVESELHAIEVSRFDYGLKIADEVNSGFFQGVPTFIKDMTKVKGLPTKYGSEAFVTAKPDQTTDKIVQQLYAQGMVGIGKSTLPEFGFTCSTEFPHLEATRNPWGTAYTAGGSSGGSAALVAAGVVPIAHCADGGGSIRIPAAACGLVGLKAQRGRLLLSSMLENQLVELAIDGIVSRTVRDTANFYAEAEKYYQNKKLPPIGLVEGPSKKKYKIGFTRNSVNSLKANDKMYEALKKTALKLEELGHEVREIEPPVEDQFHEDFINLFSMLGFFCANFGKLLFDKSYDKKKLSILTAGLAKKYKKVFYKTPFFVYRLKKSYYDYQRFLKTLDVDLLLTPTVASEAPEIGVMGFDQEFETMFNNVVDWTCFTPYANACGCPAISLPIAHDLKTDLPLGMMFWSNHGQERDLLDIAFQLEEAMPFKNIWS